MDVVELKLNQGGLNQGHMGAMWRVKSPSKNTDTLACLFAMHRPMRPDFLCVGQKHAGQGDRFTQTQSLGTKK